MVEILLTPPAKKPDCHTTSSLKMRPSNRWDTGFFLLFPSASYCFARLASSGSSERSHNTSREPKLQKARLLMVTMGGWLARASYLVHIPYVRCQYLPHLNGAMDPVVRCLSSPNFCHSYRRFSDPMQLRENEAKPQSSDILKRH